MVLIFVAFIFTSCGAASENKMGTATTNTDSSTISNSDCTFGHCEIDFKTCIEKSLYVLNEIDLTTYDSIASFYFEEVKDYLEDEPIQLAQEIQASEVYLTTLTSKYQVKMDSVQLRIKALRSELLTYDKERTGFVFIHTFLNKNDTLSAIILVNEDGSNSEAVIIKTIIEVEPELFAPNFKKLNEK